jgi:hypothetical protein
MPIQTEGTILFQNGFLADFLRTRLGQAHSVITDKPANELLTVPIEDQVETIVAQFRLIVPALREDLAHSEEPEELTLLVNDYGRQLQVPSVRYKVAVPFEGNRRLFTLCPSSYYTSFPCAAVEDQELIISLVGYNVTSDELNKQIEKIIAEVKQYLVWQGSQVEPYNDQLRGSVRKAIEDRKARILNSKNVAASLRYPLRRRPDAPLTYVSSELRRKIVPSLKPTKVAEPYSPEPTIDETEYQHILKVMGDMALMMERSPETFSKLGEEEIRDFFLLVLNGHYEGNATGETFNGSGKTDILVRDQNKNLFIGECKIWGGGKLLLATIDQLLGYLTWRDTKSAVLIFSRNKDFTSVLQSIRTNVEDHPHKKRGPDIEDKTRLRYVFGNPDDHNREIIVTVMAFSVLPPPK